MTSVRFASPVSPALPLVASLLALTAALAAFPTDATAQNRRDPRTGHCVLALPGMDQARVREGIVFKRTDGVDLKLDLYLPAARVGGGITAADLTAVEATAARPPLVIFVNGVGSARLDDETISMREWGIYKDWARLCTVNGMGAIVHEVRNGSGLEDATAMLAYVRAHATEWGVDPEAICLWSCSANVRVGYALAYDPKNTFVRSAVMCYGSPDSTVARPDLPVLVGRAGLDNPNFNAPLDRFVASSLRANAPVTLLNVHNGHHAFDLLDDDDQSRAAVRATLDWMKAQLSPSVTHARASRAAELEARREVAARNWVSADRALRAWLAAEPENGQAYYEFAGVLYQQKKFDEAAAAYERTASLGAMGPLAYYNGACSYALVGNKDKALELLEKAVATGQFQNRESIRNDPDFASIAADPRFTKIVGKAE